MIEDLGMYIIQLTDEQHEFLLFIDANEPHTYYSGIYKVMKRTKSIDPIKVRHGSKNKKNTH